MSETCDRPVLRDRLSLQERLEIEEFLSQEARLADQSLYSEWESLVDDDMVYWVPTLEGAQYPPGKRASIIYDNRSRLATRIRQLNTGVRHAQVPASPMARLLTNFEIERLETEGEYRVRCKMVIYENRIQSTNDVYPWAANVEYRLRRGADSFKMFYKAVFLVNANQPVPGLSFII
jgi:3-phenylpropionate/cinnamic acid dioxygenase small subunit